MSPRELIDALMAELSCLGTVQSAGRGVAALDEVWKGLRDGGREATGAQAVRKAVRMKGKAERQRRG